PFARVGGKAVVTRASTGWRLSLRSLNPAHRECFFGVRERNRTGYLAWQRMGERPALAAGREAESDGRGRADDRYGLRVLGHLPQLGRVEQVAPGFGQAVVVVHVSGRVDNRMLKYCRAPDPLSCILGSLSVQPRQENHRADRA